MVNIGKTFSQLAPCKIVVLGDLILDAYTIGKARRISPEAPVAVVQVAKEEFRPGGAGNVLVNLRALGAHTIAIGRVGRDTAGEKLLCALSKENIEISGVFFQNEFQTPVKNRIIAENQQIVRVDHEAFLPLSNDIEQTIVDRLPQLFEGASLVAISDYGKGFLTFNLTQSAIQLALKMKIPVVTDPKGIDFSKYRGSSIIKPNFSEAYAAANLSLESPLEKVSEKILNDVQASVLMITRSEFGISLFYPEGIREDFPVHMREIKDVTGAGDTVLAMLAFCVANGLTASQAAEFCNIAAGIAIERFGCAKITLSQFAKRLLEIHVENKVFDDHHIFVLKEALKDRKYVVLATTEEKGLTIEKFKHIQQISLDFELDVLIHLLEEQPKKEFIALLASLQEVKFIVSGVSGFKTLYQTMTPQALFLSKENQLVPITDLEDVFKNGC